MLAWPANDLLTGLDIAEILRRRFEDLVASFDGRAAKVEVRTMGSIYLFRMKHIGYRPRMRPPIDAPSLVRDEGTADCDEWALDRSHVLEQDLCHR